MTKETQDAIKREIRYTEKMVPECRACRHIRHHGDSVPYGDNVFLCSVVVALGNFPVDPKGRCELFSRPEGGKKL